ncbi:MAG: RepB family plasmid replication initiator protein, partial [Myroides sp.]
ACQWRSVRTKRFEIPELKKMLGLIDKKGNEQFERISDFKIKVLDIARKQISENTDIELDYELKKKGREFYWITLHINSQKFKQLEIDFEKPINVQKFASKLITYGFSQEQAEIIAAIEKEKNFDVLITELNEKIRQRKLKIENSVGYLVGVYQKKGILTIKK